MRPATQIVQGSQGGNRDADPLTTPIYETTTFVFDSAKEVVAALLKRLSHRNPNVQIFTLEVSS